MKKLLVAPLSVVLLSLCLSCAVRRPFAAPHRGDTEAHRSAKTVGDCLECHRDDMPHSPDRGNCLKCHRIEVGR